MTTDKLIAKWSAVLDHEGAGKIMDQHKRAVTAQLLENQSLALASGDAVNAESMLMEAPTNTTSGVQNWDPVLMGLVRRSAPNLMAYDIAGVQPMSAPTGLIFALRSRYDNQTGAEAFFNEADTAHSGTGTHGSVAAGETGKAMATNAAEALGTSGDAWGEMALTIEKITATAKSRALKAQYSLEMAQDMKAVHGLDADSELANILSTEIIAEINRETVRTVYGVAKIGAQTTTNPGEFDLSVDSDGRWSLERYRGLQFQVEREANAIARETRRGRGNIIICSSDVASALAASGALEYRGQDSNLNIDDTGNTFAGIYNKKYKVYIDPYLPVGAIQGGDLLMVGYKGTNPYDAGLFYCPYVPLQMMRATSHDDFTPKIGFKTRYAMVANPFAEGISKGDGALNANANVYYRKFAVKNLL